jgi:PAS domain S-box-containing protein
MTAWQYTPYTLPLLFTAAITAFLTVLIWQRKQITGALPVALLTTGITIWAFGYALELASTDPNLKILFAKIEYLGIATIPLAWLIFAAHFTRHQQWLSRRNLALLLIAPILTILFVWTNELHGLVWAQISQNSTAGFIVLDFRYGPWFWVHTAFSYIYLLVGAIFLIRAFLRTPQLFRGQILAILIAAFLPWAGNAIYLTNLDPFPQLDITPFTFALAGMLVVFGLLRYRFPRILPIARGFVISNLKEALIVTDDQLRIVDLNPAAENLMGVRIDKVVGDPLENRFAALAEQVTAQRNKGEALGTISLDSNETVRHFRFEISSLHDRGGNEIGLLITMADITELRREEEAYARRGRQLETVARIAREASSIHDLGQLLDEVTQLTAKQFGFYHVGLFLLDEDNKSAILQAANSEGGKRMLRRGHRLPVGEKGIVGHVAEAGKTRIALDVGEDAVFFQNPDLPETRSEMALPLIVREKVIGVFDIQSTQPQAFLQEDIEILQILADQVAISIDNARLYLQSQTVIEQLQSLSSEQVRHAWQGALHGKSRGFTFTPLGFKPLADGTHLPEKGQPEDGRRLIIPILLRGEEIGRIHLQRDPAQPAWGKREQALAREISMQTALALENARLIADSQQRAEQERIVSQVAGRMRETLDIDVILQTAAREIRNSFNLKQVEVRLQDLTAAPTQKRVNKGARK